MAPGVPKHFTTEGDRPAPISVPTQSSTVVRSAQRAGVPIPPRESDCSGGRPAWYPFQANVCDWESDPVDRDLTARERSIDPPV